MPLMFSNPSQLWLLTFWVQRRSVHILYVVSVICKRVQVEDPNAPEIVHFLLETEVFPLCLRCIDLGDELTQTVCYKFERILWIWVVFVCKVGVNDDLDVVFLLQVATLIVMKILIQEEGLKYCCALAERFFSVVQVLGRLVERLPEKPDMRLVRYAIRCYLRLSELPSILRYMHLS